MLTEASRARVTSAATHSTATTTTTNTQPHDDAHSGAPLGPSSKGMAVGQLGAGHDMRARGAAPRTKGTGRSAAALTEHSTWRRDDIDGHDGDKHIPTTLDKELHECRVTAKDWCNHCTYTHQQPRAVVRTEQPRRDWRAEIPHRPQARDGRLEGRGDCTREHTHGKAAHHPPQLRAAKR
jgi:hypothetical protein